MKKTALVVVFVAMSVVMFGATAFDVAFKACQKGTESVQALIDFYQTAPDKDKPAIAAAICATYDALALADKSITDIQNAALDKAIAVYKKNMGVQ